MAVEIDTRIPTGKVTDMKGYPRVNDELIKLGQYIYELDLLSGTDNDELIIAGKKMWTLDVTGDVLCTPTKIVCKGNFTCDIVVDEDIDAMFDNMVWNEIPDIVDAEGYEEEMAELALQQAVEDDWYTIIQSMTEEERAAAFAGREWVQSGMYDGGYDVSAHTDYDEYNSELKNAFNMGINYELG